MSDEMRLQISLLVLRVGVFVVMLFRALEQLVQPERSAAVFGDFYLLEGMGPQCWPAPGHPDSDLSGISHCLADARGLYRPVPVA